MKIFFFHVGYQPYLEMVIRQASLKNEVILIGDESNKHLEKIKNVQHFFLQEHNKDIEKFLNHYVHLSTNSKSFEEWCFIRWIAVRNIANLLNCKEVFYSDSDNLIYSNIEDVYNSINKPEIALSVPEQQTYFSQAATGEVSYWTLQQLNNFCDFLFEAYNDQFIFNRLTEKWRWHVANNINGGICDMTLLWHFIQDKEASILTDVLNNDSTFDHSINKSSNFKKNEYEFENGVKKIVFENNVPYGFNILQNKKILFHNLQFQGNSKKLIQNYVKIQ